MSALSPQFLGVSFAFALVLRATHADAQAAPPASAPDKRACSDAFETAQLLKSVGKLDEAVAQASICAASSCPKSTSVPCSAWRTEWEALLGEITLEVVDETGAPTRAATLLVDAKPALTEVPSTLRLAPGPHAFRFSRPGQPDQTSSVVLAERQKATVRVVFPSVAAKTAEPTPSASITKEQPPPPRRIPTATWALGGVGVAGLAVFAGFGLAGRADKSELDTTCAPRCSPDQASSAKTKYLIADVGLGVGVLALAGATYFALRPSPPPPAGAAASSRPRWTTLAVTPREGGATALLGGQF